MRIESVEAQAFGAFTDRRLELAPGLTIVAGPNEAGKSTWHVALYAALCGVRRGRGQPRPEDREFAERHHPWDGEAWEVSALVRLEDGRRVRLHHDLAGRVNCSATDADFGRDYSAEIMDDGAPNAAKWLGLDRDAFRSTACIRQAEIQEVLNDANALQEHLQRAAATAGADATAAAALAALVNYRREHVGTERANATKPLQRAVVALREAQTYLSRARDAHDDYVGRIERVEQLAAEADQASLARRLFEAKLAATRATGARQKLARAQELSAAHPEEPPAAVDDGALADQVATALDAWQRRPQLEGLSGRSASDLQAELDRLPAAPSGETASWPTVVTAKDSLERARMRLDEQQLQRPGEPATVDTGGLSAADLRRLAEDLGTSEPTPDPGIAERVVNAQRALDRANRSALWTLVVSAGAVLVTVLAFAMGAAAVGVAALVVAAVAGLLAWRGRRAGAREVAMGELQRARDDAATERAAADLSIRRRQAAQNEVRVHGLVPDAGIVGDLAAQHDETERIREAGALWRARLEELERQATDAEEALTVALTDRGVRAGDEVMTRMAEYELACADRQARAIEASRRPRLQGQLADRRRLEAAQLDRERERAQASERLADAARVAAVVGADKGELFVGLKDWQTRHADAIRAGEAARKEWYELQTLLDGRPLAEFESEVGERVRQAGELGRGLDPGALMHVVVTDDPDAQSRALRDAEQAAGGALAGEQRALTDFRKSVPSVAEAEEEESRCREELERIRGVDHVLATAQSFLEKAQDSVHRDLAPVLRQTLRQWLPRVTGGRYEDAIVDPASLVVHVQAPGRPLRKAQLLSHGTAEQVYLLLRMAMATHLTSRDEVCPLILDDVTVQCDAVRRRAVLDVLLELSADRQIVLFSQEAEVLAWARANLRPPHDSIVELDAASVPA